MTRQEFLDELRIALQGKIGQNRVNEHVQYYDNYIMEEARKGRTEQEVIQSLGNPRLIAKTLIDTDNKEHNNRADYDNTSRRSYDNGGELGRDTTVGYKLNRWCSKLLLILIAICIIIIVTKVLAFLLPLVLPIMFIIIIIMLISGRRR